MFLFFGWGILAAAGSEIKEGVSWLMVIGNFTEMAVIRVQMFQEVSGFVVSTDQNFRSEISDLKSKLTVRPGV
jgi:hypothetical protein